MIAIILPLWLKVVMYYWFIHVNGLYYDERPSDYWWYGCDEAKKIVMNVEAYQKPLVNKKVDKAVRGKNKEITLVLSPFLDLFFSQNIEEHWRGKIPTIMPMLKELYLNIPFVEELEEMPRYVKFMNIWRLRNG